MHQSLPPIGLIQEEEVKNPPIFQGEARRCSEHKKKLEFYCPICHMLVCYKCAFQKCKDHFKQLKELKLAIEEHFPAIEDKEIIGSLELGKEMANEKKVLEGHLKQLEKIYNERKKSFDEVCPFIEEILRNSIKDYHSCLSFVYNSIGKNLQNKLETKEKMDHKVKWKNSILDLIVKARNEEDYITVIQNRLNLQNLKKQILKHSPKVSRKSTKNTDFNQIKKPTKNEIANEKDQLQETKITKEIKKEEQEKIKQIIENENLNEQKDENVDGANQKMALNKNPINYEKLFPKIDQNGWMDTFQNSLKWNELFLQNIFKIELYSTSVAIKSENRVIIKFLTNTKIDPNSIIVLIEGPEKIELTKFNKSINNITNQKELVSKFQVNKMGKYKIKFIKIAKMVIKPDLVFDTHNDSFSTGPFPLKNIKLSNHDRTISFVGFSKKWTQIFGKQLYLNQNSRFVFIINETFFNEKYSFLKVGLQQEVHKNDNNNENGNVNRNYDILNNYNSKKNLNENFINFFNYDENVEQNKDNNYTNRNAIVIKRFLFPPTNEIHNSDLFGDQKLAFSKFAWKKNDKIEIVLNFDKNIIQFYYNDDLVIINHFYPDTPLRLLIQIRRRSEKITLL
ncbi:e3 ubiquitin-protein ligase trim56 [Anaeramoeba flamelloides]|uniref:E3 ubiquitin-protein ligase trim56 n=1 Tax=Anaeramoeba flamelloides TaxID=1746091 RepID=A0AAV7ZTC0_9EUKA|nr:e3 ubiquitin-protein ligase trim56 [Anaeramoeba flamelloides]